MKNFPVEIILELLNYLDDEDECKIILDKCGINPKYYIGKLYHKKMIIVYKISGSDPTKELQTTLYFTKKLNEVIKEIIKEVIEMDMEQGRDDDERFIKHYIKRGIELESVKKQSEIKGYKLIEKTDAKFNKPPYSELIVVDYSTSYDFHYYVKVCKVKNKVELIIHEH